MEWYYVIKGRRFGPISDEALVGLAQAGTLQRDDLVWNETLEGQWVEAGTVPHLFGLPPEIPPPVPPPSLPELPPPLPPVAAEGGAFRETPSYGDISLVAPVGLAWDRMKAILFSPFDMGKWFALGFTAWLITLQGAGAILAVPAELAGSMGGGGEGLAQFVVAYVVMIIVAGVIVFFLAAVLGLFFAWVQARGQFMFLDNVVHNTSHVAQTWRRWGRQGSSLFWWRLGYGLFCAAVLVVFMAAAVPGVLVPCIRAKTFLPAMAPAIAGLTAAMLAFMIVAGYISRFLEDFVVPLMYRNRVGAMQGWRLFMDLTHGHVGKFLLYGLFHFMLRVAAVMAVAIVVLLTCCVAGFLRMLPYIGTVVLLPLLVFFRLYSLEYMAQYGAQYDLLRGPAHAEESPAGVPQP